jgi:outer membrane protein assembly factor BamA
MPLKKCRSYISDRFFLGGPMTLRGFHMDGVGPHHQSKLLKQLYVQ